MRFSSFVRRKIHNQQHSLRLDMNKKSQNGSARQIHCTQKTCGPPKHYKHVTPCKNIFRLSPRRITTRFAVPQYTGTLSCILKLPDEEYASHTKRVEENLTFQEVRTSAAHWYNYDN